jgi:hypothetical protein
MESLIRSIYEFQTKFLAGYTEKNIFPELSKFLYQIGGAFLGGPRNVQEELEERESIYDLKKTIKAFGADKTKVVIRKEMLQFALLELGGFFMFRGADQYNNIKILQHKKKSFFPLTKKRTDLIPEKFFETTHFATSVSPDFKLRDLEWSDEEDTLNTYQLSIFMFPPENSDEKIKNWYYKVLDKLIDMSKIKIAEGKIGWLWQYHREQNDKLNDEFYMDNTNGPTPYLRPINMDNKMIPFLETKETFIFFFPEDKGVVKFDPLEEKIKSLAMLMEHYGDLPLTKRRDCVR